MIKKIEESLSLFVCIVHYNHKIKWGIVCKKQLFILEFQRMIHDIENSEINCVITKGISRL